MNERIRELAEQAKNFMTDQVLYQSRVHNRTLSVDESANIFEEKFAELIIQECTQVVADAVDHREPASTYVIKIREHFGVGE